MASPLRHPLANVAESIDLAEVDENARLGESELHHGNQAVTAGEDLCVVLIVVQQGESASPRLEGCVIVESCCYHLLNRPPDRVHRVDMDRHVQSLTGLPAFAGVTGHCGGECYSILSAAYCTALTMLW